MVQRRGGPPLLAWGGPAGPGTDGSCPHLRAVRAPPGLRPTPPCHQAVPSAMPPDLPQPGAQMHQPLHAAETQGLAHATGSWVSPRCPPASVPSTSLTCPRHLPSSCPQPWPSRPPRLHGLTARHILPSPVASPPAWWGTRLHCTHPPDPGPRGVKASPEAVGLWVPGTRRPCPSRPVLRGSVPWLLQRCPVQQGSGQSRPLLSHFQLPTALALPP